MPVLELKQIFLNRGRMRILSGISWTVEPGENWALLGANSSGKTTLLKVITGYEWPTYGSVTVFGQRFGQCDLPSLRKAIGWVSTAIEQRLPLRDTALEVVASGIDASIGLYRELKPKKWDWAREVLAYLGGAPLADRPFGLLSQGEQQRVLIARALVARPALMVLDEPCAGLDPAARAVFLGDLEQWSQLPNAPATILVTHHIEEIGPWINRVLLLKQGKALAAGTPDEVLTDARLGDAFGCQCRVERTCGQYLLHVTGPLDDKAAES